MNRRYRMLPDGSVELVEDLIEWAREYENTDHRVARVEFGGVKVSTVFLALDHGSGSGPPLLFETMVFGGEHDQDCVRYSTLDEALAGHCKMATRVLGPNWAKG